MDKHNRKEISSGVFVNKQVQNIPWRLYLIVSSVGLLIVATMSYGFYLGNYTIEKYTPLVGATMEIKLEATTAHLWFEEIISGDRFEDLNSVKQHLDQSQWYAKAMLEGGENTEGRFIPLTDPALRGEIEKVYQKINVFREITDQRYDAIQESGVGTLIDQKYDAVFDDFINQADRVESKLQAEIVQKTKILKTIQFLLTLISLLAIGCIIWLFHKFERRRFSDLQLISVANERLEKALEEVKTLQGVIPICGYCKKIRDEKGLWNQLEAYIHSHSAAEFSHGVCPECYQKQIEELGKDG